MCRSELRRKSRPCDIHVTCQDRNCSIEIIRKLIDRAGVETLLQKDVYGRVPLYYAIRSRCSFQVIQTLFDFSPNAIIERDYCGELPLYMLFRPQADSRILEHVLNTYPKLSFFEEKRFSGAQSLLQNLCSQWINFVRKKTATNPTSLDSLSSTSTECIGKPNASEIVLTRNMVCSDRALLDRWNKLVLTARAAHFVFHTTQISLTTNNAERAMGSNRDVLGHHQNPKHTVQELHVALQLNLLPPAVLCQFVEMYPDQASMKMSNGVFQTNHSRSYLGEHESRMAIEEGKRMPKCLKSSNGSSSSGDMLPLHYFLSNFPATNTAKTTPRKRPLAASSRSLRSDATGSLLKSLVRAFPEAASIGCPPRSASPLRDSWPQRWTSTNLPLHAAIAKSCFSWEEGLRELVYADPSALGVADGIGTRVVPFLQQTAVCTQHDGDETTALTTAYCLLREDPSVLSGMVASLQRP